MLVISRRNEECILIGDDIEVVVLQIDTATVKLGINAPKHIKVLRSELSATNEPKRRDDRT